MKREILKKAMNKMYCGGTRFDYLDDEERLMIYKAMEEYHQARLKLLGSYSVSSCFAVFDKEDNIVQLYQTENKANKGLLEFQNSHPRTEFHVDTIQIN